MGNEEKMADNCKKVMKCSCSAAVICQTSTSNMISKNHPCSKESVFENADRPTSGDLDKQVKLFNMAARVPCVQTCSRALNERDLLTLVCTMTVTPLMTFFGNT